MWRWRWKLSVSLSDYYDFTLLFNGEVQCSPKTFTTILFLGGISGEQDLDPKQLAQVLHSYVDVDELTKKPKNRRGHIIYNTNRFNCEN